MSFMDTATFHEPPHDLLQEGRPQQTNQGLDISTSNVGGIKYGLRLPPYPVTNPLVRPRAWTYKTSTTEVSAAARGTTIPEVDEENQCHQAGPLDTTLNVSVNDLSLNTSFFVKSRLASTSMTSLTSEDDLERSYCYKFSSLQRQLFQSEMDKMKSKMDEMKGKDEKLKEKFLELRQKRLSLGENTENSENNDLNISRDVMTQTTSSSSLVGGDSNDVPSGQGYSVGNSTDSAPVPPPRRNKTNKVRWGGGRTDPYGLGSVVSRRRLVGPETPAEEMNRLIKSLQSGKKTRAPSRPVQAPGRYIDASGSIQTSSQGPNAVPGTKESLHRTLQHHGDSSQGSRQRLLPRGEVGRLGSTNGPVSSSPAGVTRSNTVSGAAHKPPSGNQLKGILRASSVSYPASSTTKSSKLFKSSHNKSRSILGSINSNKTSTPLSTKNSSAAKALSSIFGPPPTHYMDVSMLSFQDTADSSFSCTAPKPTTEWSLFDVSHREDRCVVRTDRRQSEGDRRVGLHRRTRSGNKIYPVNLLNELDMSMAS